MLDELVTEDELVADELELDALDSALELEGELPDSSSPPPQPIQSVTPKRRVKEASLMMTGYLD